MEELKVSKDINLAKVLWSIGITDYVIIGSEGLGIAEDYSDIDIVTCQEPEGLKDFCEFDMSEYFDIIPLGNPRLIKANIDGIAFDFIIVDEQLLVKFDMAMMELRKLPKEMLERKHIRIELFEVMLMKYGIAVINTEHDPVIPPMPALKMPF